MIPIKPEQLIENKYHLDKDFIRKYENKKVNWGYNGLGEFVYLRTYSRLKENGKKEKWFETVKRVVEGTMTMYITHMKNNNINYEKDDVNKLAKSMYDYMFQMKFLPAGRGLWAMGTPIIEKKGLFAALNSCAFVSTINLDKDLSKPFEFMADMSMLGTGIGFDTKGAGKILIHKPTEKTITHIIDDSREGWVKAYRKLLLSYFIKGKPTVKFDYSKIRPKGTPLKTFGGISSGYKPLEKSIEDIRKILDNNAGDYIWEKTIVDIMNIIGVCIVSGNVRRTAQIAFGDSDDFMELKNWENPNMKYRASWMHSSNNSIMLEDYIDDYSKYVPLISKNGEPGFIWLNNARKFGRINDTEIDKSLLYKDKNALGANPCNEQTLENYEMCCLVETFPAKCKNKQEFKNVVKIAYIYAKITNLGYSHWKETAEVMNRNRRIGVSISGVYDFMQKIDFDEMIDWLNETYIELRYFDINFSQKLKVPTSIKLTSIKPSGTISLLNGSTAGIHAPIAESRYYIRRVRENIDSPLVKWAKDMGYHVEPELIRKPDGNWMESETTMVISFPVDNGFEPTIPTIEEQFELASVFQKYWSDNQVSVTIKFDPETEGKKLNKLMREYQYKLKGVSFLPRIELKTEYPQLPYEKITMEKYNELKNDIKNDNKIDIVFNFNPQVEKGCNSDVCIINM